MDTESLALTEIMKGKTHKERDAENLKKEKNEMIDESKRMLA